MHATPENYSSCDVLPIMYSSGKCDFVVKPPCKETTPKKSRFNESQIVAILKESEAGVATTELCRKHGISGTTFYKWKAKYGGMEVSDVAKLRALQDENGRLKRIVATQALDIDALKILSSGNF